MTTRILFVLCTFIVALGASQALAADWGPGKGPMHFKLAEPSSRIVGTGATVTLAFTAPAPPKGNEKLPQHYQWRKDGTNIILGQTNSTLEIVNVTTNDAATYRLLLSGAVEMESAPFHLNVYSSFTNQSNGGYLTIPIEDFISAPYTACTGTFNRYKVYMPFDGPSRSPASLDFPNTSNEGNLIVRTCLPENGTTLDTAVKIMENFGNMNMMCCDQNAAGCVANTKLSSCLAVGLASGQTYRVAVYYKNGTLGGRTTVTIGWKYTTGTVW